MSSTKCVYRKCHNRSRDISMFRFPTHDKPHLFQWIRNSGNIYLYSLTSEELRCRYLCVKHFDPSSIHKGSLRNRLIGPVVPVPFQSVKAAEETSKTIDTPPSPELFKVKMPTKCYRKSTQTSKTGDETVSTTSSQFSMCRNVNLFAETPTSDVSSDHDEDLVEDPEVPAGVEDPLAPTFPDVKEETSEDKKWESPEDTPSSPELPTKCYGKSTKTPKTGDETVSTTSSQFSMCRNVNLFAETPTSDRGSDFSSDHDEDLVEEPEVPAGIEDPLAPTLPDVKEETSEDKKWESPEATTFTCTECLYASYGVTLTCLQWRDVQMCLRCDAEGRHSYHCLLKAPAMRHLDILKRYLLKVRKEFVSLLEDTLNDEERSAMIADAERKLEARQKKYEEKEDVQTQPTSEKEDSTATSEVPMPMKEESSPTAEITTHSKTSSEIGSFLPSWSESHAEQVIITEEPPQSALIRPVTDLTLPTLEAPQLNVPIAVTSSYSELTSPSISAASQLGSQAKRKAVDPVGRKRRALDGDSILADISEEVEDDVMDVTEVKTEPLDDRVNGAVRNWCW